MDVRCLGRSCGSASAIAIPKTSTQLAESALRNPEGCIVPMRTALMSIRSVWYAQGAWISINSAKSAAGMAIACQSGMASRSRSMSRIAAAPTLSGLGALLLALTVSGVARAEPDEAPLAQMRSAAEQLAEVAPALTSGSSEKPLLPPSAASRSPASADHSQALRQLVLTALHEEVARELIRPEGSALARANVGAKDMGNGDSVHDASSQARTAAAAAQQAKQAHSVATQHISAPMPKGAPEFHR